MMTRRNFSGRVPPNTGDELEFRECNFSQPMPRDVGGLKRGIILWPGDGRPRTFTRCNLCNAEPPAGSTMVECLTVVKAFRVLQTSENVTLDGVVVGAIQTWADIIYGRQLSGGVYEYKPTPELIAVE